ncbi:MAG: TerB N-terminal domain-containing protein, partial [Vallitaleaceae bacterium]|nr:TerB N-terminal domain-containing protein [Vallitaleaceae bacterium]
MNHQSDHRDTKKNTNTNTETQISLDGLFYEIEYDTTHMKGVGKYVLKSQPIQAESKEDPKKAEIRELFHKMRDLARHNFTPMANYSRFFDQRVRQDNSAVFYQQAIFMKDFEDDYSEQVPFSAYFPYYQMMGYEQLRSYFTWRSKVRKGIIEATSLSYVFLYLYELLNQIGVDHPEDGLFRILTFWSKYRFFDGTIDRYL